MCSNEANAKAAIQQQRQISPPLLNSITQLNIRGVNNGFIVEDHSSNIGSMLGHYNSNINVFKTWSEVSDFISNYNHQK